MQTHDHVVQPLSTALAPFQEKVEVAHFFGLLGFDDFPNLNSIHGIENGRVEGEESEILKCRHFSLSGVYIRVRCSVWVLVVLKIFQALLKEFGQRKKW